MDTTLKDWPAQYDKDKKTISFRSRGDIHWSSVAEELLHVLQHQCFYGSTMDPKYKNYEFEVLEMDSRRILKVKFTIKQTTAVLPKTD